MMIDALIEAARLARRASSPGGERTLEILITEDGFVVRGVQWEGDSKRATSQDLPWPSFEQNPGLLANSVNLAVDQLGRRG